MASRACQASGERKAGTFGHRLLLDDGLGDNDELTVLAGNVEMMNIIAKVVAVGEDAASRADGERKSQAVLLRVGARMHARFHDAFADRLRIAIAREVPDGIEIHCVGSSRSPEQIESSTECSSDT